MTTLSLGKVPNFQIQLDQSARTSGKAATISRPMEKRSRGDGTRWWLASGLASALLFAGCTSGGAPSSAPAAKPEPAKPPSRPPVTAATVAKIEADFVRVPAGTLPAGYRSRKSYDTGKKDPAVRIEGFSLGKHEVTAEEWIAVMGENPSDWQGSPRLPITNVSWRDAKVFLDRLNQAKGGGTFRLPTAEEWEYACRAGAVGKIAAQANEAALNQHAWWGKNSSERVHAVAGKKPNAWGLFDMLGNVAEWCETESDTKSTPPLRVIAGANFADENLVGQDCRPGGAMSETGRDAYTGLRLAKSH